MQEYNFVKKIIIADVIIAIVLIAVMILFPQIRKYSLLIVIIIGVIESIIISIKSQKKK